MKNKKSAFTLIELMIVIVIIAIMSMIVAAPYQFYQKKQKVKNAIASVAQTLYETRALAINGNLSGTSNSSFWLFFEQWKTAITVYKYPLWVIADYTKAIYIYKKIQLDPWVELTSVNSKSQGLFIYDAITWEATYFSPPTSIPITSTNIWNKISLWVKLTWSTSPILEKKLDYYTKTHISNIE